MRYALEVLNGDRLARKASHKVLGTVVQLGHFKEHRNVLSVTSRSFILRGSFSAGYAGFINRVSRYRDTPGL